VVDRLDELRLVRRLSESMPQSALAEALSVSQPAIHKAIKRAEMVGEIPEGFSGATPYEIAERYAAGLIDRARLVTELAAWGYAPSPVTDGVDWLVVEVPGTFGDVVRALSDGLIDEAIYEEVLDATEVIARADQS
jgi:DNA-binding Lrp family transcriptional regulator